MAKTTKQVSLQWKKIRAAVVECEAVDQKVVDLLVGLGHMPLSKAAEKVKEAVDVVQPYVAGVSAVLAEAKNPGGSTMVNQASRAKDNLYIAVEGLRNAIAEVNDRCFSPTWDEIAEEPESPTSTSACDYERLVEGYTKRIREHISRVTDAIRRADGAANSGLAVVALAKKMVEEAPNREARFRMGLAPCRMRQSIPGYMLCPNCTAELLYCQCSKSERGRKRARESEEGADEEPSAKVKVEINSGC